jgi:hypothetical protein
MCKLAHNRRAVVSKLPRRTFAYQSRRMVYGHKRGVPCPFCLWSRKREKAA